MDTQINRRRIHLRDSTLREGQDVPGVAFSPEQKLRIATLLDQAGVPEIEIVAPARVRRDLEFAELLEGKDFSFKTSGLVFAASPRCREEAEAVCKRLHNLVLLMPLSDRREPRDMRTKMRMLLEALDFALQISNDVGVGFPHSTQADPKFLLDSVSACQERGAQRVFIYDTNGSSDFVAIHSLIQGLKASIHIPLVFHAHNDLGLATANSLAAVLAGADGLDATVNGLGDRAGNASLEQLAMLLHLKGMETGIRLDKLKQLSQAVQRESGIPLLGLAPIVGDFVATHKSLGHLENPGIFEAFDPSLVGMERKTVQSKDT